MDFTWACLCVNSLYEVIHSNNFETIPWKVKWHQLTVVAMIREDAHTFPLAYVLLFSSKCG